MRLFAGLCAVLLCATAGAGEFDLGFNSDAVRANYIYDFSRNELSGDIGLVVNSDRGTVIHASLFRQGFASDGANPLKAGLGLRTGYVDGDASGQTGIPLALGLFARYQLPNFDRISIRGEAWYAPDVLTTSDLEKYQDFSIKLQYAFLREADIWVGASYLDTEFSNGTRQIIYNGMNIGFNIRF